MKQKSYPQQVAVSKEFANGPTKGIVEVEPFPVPEKPTILEGVRSKVFLDRYSWKDEVGNSIEKYPEQMWGRVAKAISSVEKTSQLRNIWQEKFYDALSGFKFLPGGRILSAAGTGYEVTFYNCFVIPSPEDSRGGIIDNLKTMIEIMSRAGGVGINLSTLRPRGARVHKVNGTSSGPVNWANLYSVGTHDVIQQGGSRRGALMLMLNDWHPDVEEFIEIKKDLSRINGANLSVCVSDSFMEAVENDGEWVLRFPDTKYPGYDDIWDGDILDWETKGYPVKVYKVTKAKEIWEKICQAAWASAEPGLHFLERSNKQSNTWYFEKLLATNPCVTSDTWVHTVSGPRQVIDLLGKPFLALVNGQNKLSGPNGFFRTGTKKVVRIKTEEGFQLRLTSDHLILTVSEMRRNTLKTIWYKAGGLKKGDKIVLHNHRSNPYWSGQYTFNDGYLLGLLIGDGTLKHDKAVLSVWQSPLNVGIQGVMQQTLQATSTVPHRSDFNGWIPVRGRSEYRLSLSYINRLANALGLQHGNKTVTPLVEKTSSSFYRGFLRGLFDCDGSVQGNQIKGVSIRLAQSDLPMLLAVQRMLLRLGIVSQIYSNRRKAGKRLLPDGKSGLRKYSTKAQHELVISRDNLLSFAELINFAEEAKSKKLQTALKSYRRSLNKERFIAEVKEVVVDGIENVYDVHILGVNAFDANGLYAHNCGEQPLGAWAVCNLGALNLSAFVKDSKMDYDKLAEYAKIATRFLDNVVDANFYFYEENEKQQKGIRRTGLGTMGLGDALIKMKVRYGSDQSLEVIEKIYKTIRDASYETSADLAAEKGSFPKFDKEKYLQGSFIKQLPDVIKEKIAKNGIRNAVVLTQAPTGTTSLLAGVSSGIEPVYDFAMVRRDRTGEHIIYHPLYKEWKDAHPDEKAPDYFVSANDLTPDDHVKVQAMIQKYTDSSISKTVNAPNSHTVDQVRGLYMKAYKLGCKGVTYMRDGSREGVLSHADGKLKTSEQPATLPQPIHRAAVLNGRTYKMLTPVGEAFITINRDEMGQPMEVFATIGKAGMQTGADAEAIGRLISLALRIADGSRMEVAKKIISQLRGIGGSSQVGFGKNRVMSLGDAIAKVLAEELSLASDDSGQILTLDLSAEQLSIMETKATLARGDLCPECGESTFVLEEGCSKCYSCGYSKC